MVDGLNNRVQKFTGDGRFLSSWGRSGLHEGQLNMPWGTHIDAAGERLHSRLAQRSNPEVRCRR